jgi:hypothetical protein
VAEEIAGLSPWIFTGMVYSILQGLKPGFSRQFNVAAEAATHKPFGPLNLRDNFGIFVGCGFSHDINAVKSVRL